MRESLAQGEGEMVGRVDDAATGGGRNGQDGLPESIHGVGGFPKLQCEVIPFRTGDNHLQEAAAEEGGGKTVGGGEEAVLRGNACEGFQSFFREGLVTVVPRVVVQADEGDGGYGIGAGSGRILEGLTANVEAAHGRGVRGTIEKAAPFGVAVEGDGEVQGFFRGIEIAGIERGFVGVEEREDAEDLIVERAFEGGAADAVAEPARLAPDFFQYAVE